MEFLGNLGIDTKLLLAQIINFALLLWLLKRFLYRPIIKRIEKDEVELEQAKIKNETLDRDKEEFKEQQKKEITLARQKAQEIIEEAESIAKEIKQRAQIEAEEEKEKTIKQIHSILKEIEDEKNK